MIASDVLVALPDRPRAGTVLFSNRLSEFHEVNQSEDQFEIVIASTLESGQASVEQIMNRLCHSGFDDRELLGIRLSLDEAVTNAIIHGNELSPRKFVRINFLLNRTGVRVEVEDQGNGFRPEDVPDPTIKEISSVPAAAA